MTIEDLINNRVFVIAEAGKNFIQSQGDRSVEEYLENAKALAKAAKEAGCDAVKFQTHNVADEQVNIDVVSPHFKGSDRFSWVTRNTLATPVETFWRPLKAYCDKIGIIFFSTPMSRGAAKILNDLDVELWKAGSGDLLDFVMLDYLASTGKPIIISSGMSTDEEVDKAIAFLKKRKTDFALLHCVSKYPCPPEELKLGTIEYFKNKHSLPIGFSDHSVGDNVIDSALAALEAGAQILEKHFSFSRDLWGSDHKASITPEEMKKLVEFVRDFEKEPEKTMSKIDQKFRCYDQTDKVLQEGEAVFRPYFRKTIVAARDIKKGEIIKPEDVHAMRPQAHIEGLPSEEYDKVIGKKAKKDLKKTSGITKKDI